MQPGNYTELFFLDEAVALAAGHRPCALCRRGAFNAYMSACGHRGSAAEMDDKLHEARAIPRKFKQRRRSSPINALPDFAIVLSENEPHLVRDDALIRIAPEGYKETRPRPHSGDVTVLTPEPSIEALRGGYTPRLHPSFT